MSEKYICKNCDGKGFITSPGTSNFVRTCSKCKGEGELDWLENVFGKITLDLLDNFYINKRSVIKDVESLPTEGYIGEIVYVEDERKSYVFVDQNKWVPIIV